MKELILDFIQTRILEVFRAVPDLVEMYYAEEPDRLVLVVSKSTPTASFTHKGVSIVTEIIVKEKQRKKREPKAKKSSKEMKKNVAVALIDGHPTAITSFDETPILPDYIKITEAAPVVTTSKTEVKETVKKSGAVVILEDGQPPMVMDFVDDQSQKVPTYIVATDGPEVAVPEEGTAPAKQIDRALHKIGIRETSGPIAEAARNKGSFEEWQKRHGKT